MILHMTQINICAGTINAELLSGLEQKTFGFSCFTRTKFHYTVLHGCVLKGSRYFLMYF